MKDERRKEKMLRVCKDTILAMEIKRERDSTLLNKSSYGYRIAELEDLEEALLYDQDEDIITALWNLANFPKDVLS